MLATAIAIGLSRSGFGPGTALASRYITLTAPLLGALYIAWLAYGYRPTRVAVHTSLFAIVCLAAPANIAFGLQLWTKSQWGGTACGESHKGGAHSSAELLCNEPAPPSSRTAIPPTSFSSCSRQPDLVNSVVQR